MASTNPENLVSFYTAGAEKAAITNELVRVSTVLASATTALDRADLHARKDLLKIQAALAEGDAHYKHRRYDEALSSYQEAGKLILALLDAEAVHQTPPLEWIDEPVAGPLLEVSAGLVSNLTPGSKVTPAVALDQPVTLPLAEIGSQPMTTVEAVEEVDDEILKLSDSAEAAIEQGRWQEAHGHLSTALEKVNDDPNALPETRAALLLNLGALDVQLNDASEAAERFEQAGTLFTELDDKLGAAQVKHNKGMGALRAGNGDEAAASLKEARELAGEASLRGLLRTSSNGNGQPENGNGNAPAPPSDGPTFNPTLPPINPTFTPVPLDPSALQPRRLPTEAVISSNIHALESGLATDGLRGRSTDLLASQLGSADMELKFRSLRKGAEGKAIMLETPSQQEHQEFQRNLTIAAGDSVAHLSWNRREGLSGTRLREDVLEKVKETIDPKRVGFQVDTVAGLAAKLPRIYHCVLAIKMGDCHHHLGQFEEAREQYVRAANSEYLNTPVEAPNLWRRLAANALARGDAFYREEQTEEALPAYGFVIAEDGTVPDSLLYTNASLEATGTKVKGWLTAVQDGEDTPDLNPALAEVLQQIRLRWQYIRAGLDFYGDDANVVPPFTFKYLQETALYFANQANQAEQRFIQFFERYENGEMTRRDLENSRELADRQVDAAREREKEARAMLDAAEANVDLAEERHENAQDLLDEFNDTAWESRQLSGFIARGNAFTGRDVDLDYGIGDETYKGDKHEVLQDMTRRKTQISQELQRTRLENTRDEMDESRDVAEAQREAAEARHEGAKIQRDIADLRAGHAGEMLEAFNDRFFDPEQWMMMALVMRQLASTALDRATEIARLMERAYNFEFMEERNAIGNAYSPSATRGLLGAALLKSDIESFTHHRVTSVEDKPVPVKWAVSLSEYFPGAFEVIFKQNGRMNFDIDLDLLAASHPGTYRHQLTGAELEVDGFLPPEGLRGRLTNSGLGRYRDEEGNKHLRVQPAETLVLSRFERRRDGVYIMPDREMRGLFEGNSAASGWTLEIPAARNDVDLHAIFDVRLVLYFECLFDRRLFEQDSQPPTEEQLRRSRALYLRYAFPDAYFSLRETGSATFDVQEADFPRNHRQPTLRSLALAAVPTDGASLEDAPLSVAYPGTESPVEVVFDDGNAIPQSELPVAATPSALGTYTMEMDPDSPEHRNKLEDLVVIMDYGYQPPS